MSQKQTTDKVMRQMYSNLDECGCKFKKMRCHTQCLHQRVVKVNTVINVDGVCMRCLKVYKAVNLKINHET